MREALEQRLTWRNAVAAFSAYVMVLHVIAMGAMAMPGPLATDLAAPFQLCSHSLQGDPLPGTPDHHGSQHPDCNLCSIGHCGMALPSLAVLPSPAWVQVANVAPVYVERLPPVRHGIVAQPRGPPIVT